MEKVLIIHNIIAPYKTLLFNEMYKMYGSLKVLYIAPIASEREWNIEWENMKFPYELIYKKELDRINPFFLGIKTLKKIYALNPEIIILGGYSNTAYLVAYLWARLRRKKIILWSCTTFEDRERNVIKEKIKSLFLKGINRANVYGVKSLNYLENLGFSRKKISKVGNNTANDFYSRAIKLRRDKGVLRGTLGACRYNFLFIGRFSEEKNIFFLLDAYRRLGNPNWGLILVGNGPQRKEIENFILDNNIKGVLLPGFQEGEKLLTYLAVSDVFILPSLSETWGLVINEAMAAGLPVLVSNKCGCYPDLIREGTNGFSFDPKNIEQLYGHMKKIINGEYNLEEMSKSSLEIIRNYTPQKAAKIVINTINKTLS